MDLYWVFSIAVFTVFKIFTGFVDKSNFVVNINLKEFFQYSLYDESNLYEEESKGQDSEAAAVCNNAVLWSKNPAIDKYEVIYDKSQIRGQKLEGLLNYVEGYIELASNIVFREKTGDDKNFVTVTTAGGGCYVVYSGTKENFSMTLSLPPPCWTVSVIVHEVLHTLGFMHEQQRKDRNEYIVLYRQSTGYESQYDITCDDENFRPFPYEVLSSMHYCNYPNLAYKTVPRDRSLEEYLANPRTFMTSCDWYALNEVYPGAWKLSGCRPNYIPPSLVPTESFKSWNKDAEKICQYMNGPFFDIKQCVLRDGREYPDVVDELKEFIVSSPYTKEQEFLNTTTSNDYDCSKIEWLRLRRICEETIRKSKDEKNGADGNTREEDDLRGSTDVSDDSPKVDDNLKVDSKIEVNDSESNDNRNGGANLDTNQNLIDERPDGNIPDTSSTFRREKEIGGVRCGDSLIAPLQWLMNKQGILYLNNPYYNSWIFNRMSDVNGFVRSHGIDRLGREFRYFPNFPSNGSYKPTMLYSNMRRFLGGIMKRTKSSDDVEKNTSVKSRNSALNRKLIHTRPLKRSPKSNGSNRSGRHRFLQSRPDTESDAIEQRGDALISQDFSDSLKDTIQSNNISHSLKKKSSYRRDYLTLHRKLIGSAKPKISTKLHRPKKSNSPRLLQSVSDTDAHEDAPNENVTAPIEEIFSQSKRNMTIEEKQFLHLLKHFLFPSRREGRFINRYNWRILY